MKLKIINCGENEADALDVTHSGATTKRLKRGKPLGDHRLERRGGPHAR